MAFLPAVLHGDGIHALAVAERLARHGEAEVPVDFVEPVLGEGGLGRGADVFDVVGGDAVGGDRDVDCGREVLDCEPQAAGATEFGGDGVFEGDYARGAAAAVAEDVAGYGVDPGVAGGVAADVGDGDLGGLVVERDHCVGVWDGGYCVEGAGVAEGFGLGYYCLGADAGSAFGLVRWAGGWEERLGTFG